MKNKGLPLKTKLLATFLPLILFFILALFFKNYISTKSNIDKLVYKKLEQLSESVYITIKTMIDASLQTYIEEKAKSGKMLIDNLFKLYKQNIISYNVFINKVKKILSNETQANYILLNVKKYPNKINFLIKPKFKIKKQNLKNFINEALEKYSGYKEIKLLKKGTNKKITKSFYYIRIKYLNLILFASVNKEKVKSLANLEDIDDDILSLKIGDHGYVSIMDIKGTLLIHPWNQNENVYDQRDVNNKYIFREMIKNKNGKLTYFWEYGHGVKKSIIYYKYIPDIKLIVWLTTALEDHYTLLYRNRNISIIFLLASIIIIIITILFISSSLVKPFNNIISTFNEITRNMDFKKVKVEGNKEVIDLCNSFNVMINEIEMYSDNLEEIVADRTKEIIKTNKNLRAEVKERKSAEEALKESEKRYSRLANATFEGIIIHIDTKIIDCNQAFCEMFGYEYSEVFSISGLEVIAEHDRELVRKKIESNYEEPYEALGIKKDGTTFNLEICGRNIPYKGKSARVVALRDITERKKAEEEIRLHREHLQDLVEDRTKELEAANEELETAYEQSQALNEEMEKTQNELLITNQRLEEAVKMAEDANRLKSEFLAMMSHELRTPLTGMLGFSQLLLKDKKLTSEQIHSVDIIYKSGNKLLEILTDLLELSVIEAGKLKIDYKEFKIDELLDGIYLLLKDQFEKNNLDFIKETNDIVKMYSDPLKIRQILFNLIGNAVKFTNEGKISVSVEIKNDKYIFKVKDTGIGISEKNQKIIFDMFRQVEDPYTRHFGGTGLGLAICLRLVKTLNGELSVESKEGVGSTFYFSLPIPEKKIKPQINTESKSAGKKPSRKGDIKILFAEDDETNFEMISQLLTNEMNIKAKGFEDGQQLLNYFKKDQKVDLILLDIQMPVLNGIDCLEEIRKLDKEVAVIALTAFAMQKDAEKYVKLGFSDYIAKPIDIDDFISKIKSFL